MHVDTLDANNFTALVHAVRNCELEATKFLLDKGSNVNHLFLPFPDAELRDILSTEFI